MAVTWSPERLSIGCLVSTSRPLQKASKNRPRKPHGINGRISPIRLFHNVWVKKLTDAGAT